MHLDQQTHGQGGGAGQEFVVGLLSGLVLRLPLLGNLSLGGEQLVVPPLTLVHALVLSLQVLTHGGEVRVEEPPELSHLRRGQQLQKKFPELRLLSVCFLFWVGANCCCFLFVIVKLMC